MQKEHGYTYSATIPDSLVRTGFISYYITVRQNGRHTTYPGEIRSYPYAWDFYGVAPYRVRVAEPAYPIYLFDAQTDADDLNRRWLRTSSLRPLPEAGQAELVVNVKRLFAPDPENQQAEPIYDYSMRYYFGEKVKGRTTDLAKKTSLIFKGRALNDKDCPLQLALVMKDGTAFGGIIDIKPERGAYSLNLKDLKKVKLVTLPRPYPTFLPYYFDPSPGVELDLKNIETLQVSIGPGIPLQAREQAHGIALERIWLE